MLLHEDLKERWLFLLVLGLRLPEGPLAENGVILYVFIGRLCEDRRSLHLTSQPPSAPLRQLHTSLSALGPESASSLI